MPRLKQHASAAEKQAAYRARHSDKRPPREDTLAALARTLHGAVQDAGAAGDPLALAVAGTRADDTLRNLIEHFKAKAPRE